ncbi:ankyrin repeat domain-containing protein [archaeon]|nr:MAG: ankyrin repeat domain-containing protein [archaeon]
MNLVKIFLFIVSFLSSHLLSAARRNGVRNPLFEASFIADIDRVSHLLSRVHSDILTAELPILVDYADEEYNRTALLVCGLDPQYNNRSKLDGDCTSIAHMLFVHNATMSWVDTEGWDALSMGATRGLVQYCQYLLTHHTHSTHNSSAININHCDKQNRTALMKAVLNEELQVVKLLLEHNADVSLQDYTGQTALHYSVLNVVRATQYNSSSNRSDTSASSGPAFNASMEILTTLLKSVPGGVITVVDKDDRTVLMYSTLLDSIPIIELLLEYGADPRQRDKFGVTVYDMARSEGSRALLLEAVARKAEEEHQKWLKQSSEILDVN